MRRSLLLLSTACCIIGAAEAALPFLAGADMSHLALMESRGHLYRDGTGARDALAILKAHGITCIRLRLWTCSDAQAAADPYNHGNTLAATLVLARRVKAVGLKLLLDLHYSDSWADPGHQQKPMAWEGLSMDQLEEQMYRYNRDTIAAFRTAGVLPDLVQIGNETPMGLVWPEGKVDSAGKWRQLARLIRAADRGIAEASGAQKPQTIIHLDRGGDWETTRWFFDELIRTQGVAFDIIGESYYPFWHGSLDALTTCLNGCVGRYGKSVIIAETAFPWAASPVPGTPTAINGIPIGPDGQVRFATDLRRILAALPQGAGRGVFWWGAEFQTTPGLGFDGFESRSFWDQHGTLLPVVDALAGLTAPRHD